MSNEQTATKNTRRMLPVRITDDEITLAAMAAAQYAQEYKEVEANKKAFAAEYTAKLKDLRASINEQSQIATSGEQTRPVECEWLILREDNRKRLFRTDTNEMIEEAALTPAEMQAALFD